MTLENLIKRVDYLIKMGHTVLRNQYRYEGDSEMYVHTGPIKGFRSAALSFIERIYKKDHPHYIEFESNTKGFSQEDAQTGIAILEVIKDEIEGGWLFSIKGLVTAEVFADFLEMAEYLLNEGYKDPSAVMIGSVLEEHLRQLCLKKNISIEDEKNGKSIVKKADRLNADLTKNETYSKLDQKMITAWLDLRNKAAHGKYSEYTKEQVSHMMLGVTEFMVRVPI